MPKLQRITLGENAYAKGVSLQMVKLPMLRAIDMGVKSFGGMDSIDENNDVIFESAYSLRE